MGVGSGGGVNQAGLLGGGGGVSGATVRIGTPFSSIGAGSGCG